MCLIAEGNVYLQKVKGRWGMGNVWGKELPKSFIRKKKTITSMEEKSSLQWESEVRQEG